MTGYSLHIGLNHVDPNAYGGWDGALGGCVNDANSMQQLAATAGFSTSMLIDGQATSQAVVGEIARLAQRACPGDICLVTYSGHGGQVDDWNSDEEDGQDETWVLYDRQVVDDELFQMWSQFAAGVRVLVLSDSCHSGTVAKMMIARESRQAMAGQVTREVAPQLNVVTTPKSMPFDVQTRDNEQRRGTYEFVQALSGSRDLSNVNASVLLISGCQDNQLSYDGPVNGQFTGTLLRVWNNGGFSGDYTAFHAAILAQMPPDQSPNLFQTGASDPAFLGQRPFTIAAPAGSVPAPQNGLPPTTQPSRPTLRQGASGPDVVYLQQRLNAYGASLTADGMFGPMTTAAVRTFQAGHGLVADGVVGPQTWNALGTAPVPGTSSTGSGVPGGASGNGATGVGTTVVARPTVRRGSTGPDVQYLQGRLSSLGYWLAVDGIFGPGTESTVRSFQASNGLPADGIVGQQTWAAVG